ncbi:MAG TPA: hypothetical protein VGM25_05140 [Caulobacteraceae bacterium]|jgi:hypothetical protein
MGNVGRVAMGAAQTPLVALAAAAALVVVPAARAEVAKPLTIKPLAVKPLAEAAAEQLRACLFLPGPASSPSGAGVASPPGLGRAGRVIVTEVPTDRGKLYAYRDPGHGEVVCGIALYGVDPKAIAERLVEVVKASPRRLVLDSPPHYSFDAKPGLTRYFADPKAPGMTGAMIVERPVGDDAPSLEADFHVVLIF